MGVVQSVVNVEEGSILAASIRLARRGIWLLLVLAVIQVALTIHTSAGHGAMVAVMDIFALRFLIAYGCDLDAQGARAALRGGKWAVAAMFLFFMLLVVAVLGVAIEVVGATHMPFQSGIMAAAGAIFVVVPFLYAISFGLLGSWAIERIAPDRGVRLHGFWWSAWRLALAAAIPLVIAILVSIAAQRVLGISTAQLGPDSSVVDFLGAGVVVFLANLTLVLTAVILLRAQVRGPSAQTGSGWAEAH